MGRIVEKEAEIMFTGLVEERGELLEMIAGEGGSRLIIRGSLVSVGVTVGESIAVNGCCLTVAACAGETLSFDLLGETLRRTNLGGLSRGAPVNLERAMAVGGRLGGHFVQGHIDTSAVVESFEKVEGDYRLEISVPEEFAGYVVNKGSIAIDGISLTIGEVREKSCVLWIIPHTYAVTNLGAKQAGDMVNVEFDLLAKYVERLVAVRGLGR